ncbi:hypothetical protein N7456_000987 [Penicillium angulare]|uniref:Uncharacterized protein n=1 Tax=Penicillium angulare TaxID=116970 RepID=A0A9W9GD25_9EURO|nr:hypothetical protein N7456_000987 [Penicillium angulare]
MTTQITGREFMTHALPTLEVGAHRVESSALHKERFIGGLNPWVTFESEAATTFRNHAFNTLPLLAQRSNSQLRPLTREVYQVGDEHGVQSRFSQNVGHILTIIAEDNNLNFRFVDAKSVDLGSLKTPDFLIRNRPLTSILAVGELKTPWVLPHSLSRAISQAAAGKEELIRHILGQIAGYMNEFSLKYGIISTYEETVFLRQTVARGRWCLDYSPVVYHGNQYRDNGPRRSPTISTRQGFMHIARLANQGSVFDRGQSVTRNNRLWTRPR